MRAGEVRLLADAGALVARPVLEAKCAQIVVSAPAVGVHDRAELDARIHERPERFHRGVGEDLQAHSARALAADLDRHAAQRLLTARTAAFWEPTDVSVGWVTGLAGVDIARPV